MEPPLALQPAEAQHAHRLQREHHDDRARNPVDEVEVALEHGDGEHALEQVVLGDEHHAEPNHEGDRRWSSRSFG